MLTQGVSAEGSRLSPWAGHRLKVGRGETNSKSINKRTERVMTSKPDKESVSERGSDQASDKSCKMQGA